MQNGKQHLLHATELDPSLLSARVDLAHLCTAQEFYGFVSPDEAAKQVRQIAEMVDVSGQGLALMPALGWMTFHFNRDLAGAIQMFSASAHLPHEASTTCLRVMFALSRHHFDEALEWLRPALLADPYAPCLHSMLAWTLHLAGRQSKSMEAIENALALFPDHEEIQAFGALILSFNGQAEYGTRLAQDLVCRAPYFDLAASILAYALACNDKREEAHVVLERLQWLTRERFVLRSFLPAGFVALGALDEAIAELQAADQTRCPWFFQMLADPRLAPLRGHPDFDRMRESLEKLEYSVEENFEYQT
jgi:tetratricopeptide (TPR) repeat protein